jgi:DegV family protein with EDD domain
MVFSFDSTEFSTRRIIGATDARRAAIPRVAILTDSTACIPPSLAQELGIEVLPLQLQFDERVYFDGMTDSIDEFYETLRTASRPPTTAAPSPGAYAEAILRVGKSADAVVCATVSRQFSAMYDAAVQGAAIAREQAPGLDIQVLDSRAAAMAQGFVVLEAARAARRGATVEEVLAAAEMIIPKVQLLVVIDTLTYLSRSGRVPRLVVWASSPLQVKPIVQFQGGAYRPVAIVRTKRRAIDKLVQLLERRTAGGSLHVCVHHTNVPQEAEELAQRVRASLQPNDLFVQEFTQVMGVHAGPGLLGFAFYVE